MQLSTLVQDPLGAVHLIFSIGALLLGTLVLLEKKGTARHQMVGYFYAVSMIGVNGTAFMIYRLFDGFGMFHWMAVVSTLTLVAGLIPVLRKKGNDYIIYHFSFMYWSVMGLYGAFVSETLVRLPDLVVVEGVPNQLFYSLTGIGVALTMGLGAWGFIRNKKRWEKQFSNPNYGEL
jgi:uncharacterized membrane protein